tara:strand:- start:391 stop:600 length:210 start_codon:yes stop_codon:yes gene_type:complete
MSWDVSDNETLKDLIESQKAINSSLKDLIELLDVFPDRLAQAFRLEFKGLIDQERNMNTFEEDYDELSS